MTQTHHDRTRGIGRAGACALIALGVALAAAPLAAQTPTMPSTVRYGSGLIDVPVSSVLPHLQVTGTLSGFFSQLGRRVLIDENGDPAGFGPGRDDFLADGSFAVGLFDRAEAGITLQSFGDAEDGGAMWGLFSRVRLWEPVDQGVGLAAGGRYVAGPNFGDGIERSPGRLGFPDERLRPSYGSSRGVDTDLTLYAVATAYLRGWDGGRLPPNDMTFTLGYGTGMFAQGEVLDYYSDGHANGWFMGAALHMDTSDRSQLTLMAEHNGFDLNIGAHYDWAGARVGLQYLGANHAWPPEGHESEYQKAKWGVLGSYAICPGEQRLRCTPRTMVRVEPDTIYMPAPPPDTIVVEVGEARPLPEGRDASICLSTGRNVPIIITAANDTIVGPAGISMDEARPVLDFAGSYAGDDFWYLDETVIIFEGADYGPSEDTFPIDCDQILRVGRYSGVPVFAVLTAARPFDVLFIPVSPGVWRRYERGLREERAPRSER